MELDQNNSGMIKLNLCYDQKASDFNDTYDCIDDDDDTSTLKSYDNIKENLSFQSCEKSNVIDISHYMSFASIFNKQEHISY